MTALQTAVMPCAVGHAQIPALGDLSSAASATESTFADAAATTAAPAAAPDTAPATAADDATFARTDLSIVRLAALPRRGCSVPAADFLQHLVAPLRRMPLHSAERHGWCWMNLGTFDRCFGGFSEKSRQAGGMSISVD